MHNWINVDTGEIFVQDHDYEKLRLEKQEGKNYRELSNYFLNAGQKIINNNIEWRL
ncbi:MAG: hypothetical protein ACYDEE_03750 [Ignavibacteriaceae bacterium]